MHVVLSFLWWMIIRTWIRVYIYLTRSIMILYSLIAFCFSASWTIIKLTSMFLLSRKREKRNEKWELKLLDKWSNASYCQYLFCQYIKSRLCRSYCIHVLLFQVGLDWRGQRHHIRLKSDGTFESETQLNTGKLANIDHRSAFSWIYFYFTNSKSHHIH